MRLLFVRHGDPDYKNDCLNEIGLREARALAALGPQIGWGTCFVSPLGRAQETAAVVLGRAVPGAHGAAAAVGCTDLSLRGDDDVFVRAGLRERGAGFGASSTGLGARGAGFGASSTGLGERGAGFGASSTGLGARGAAAGNDGAVGCGTDAAGRNPGSSGEDLIKTLDWLQEFPAQVDPGAARLLNDAFCFKKNEDGTVKKRVVWDMYPAYYHEHPAYSDYNAWRTTPVAGYSDTVSVYDGIIRSFDEFLAERGYVREGRHYRVEKESTETITFFCHFGVTCVLLSHMWNVSPFVPLQSLCMPTSSVTEVYSEERQKGIAHFRATRIGDTTHLTMAGLKPERLPHSALFAEVYSDFSQRHD